MQVVVSVPDHIPMDELQRKIKEFETSLAEYPKTNGREGGLLDALDRLRAKGTFSDIQDPVNWQRELREDRDLPYR